MTTNTRRKYHDELEKINKYLKSKNKNKKIAIALAGVLFATGAPIENVNAANTIVIDYDVEKLFSAENSPYLDLINGSLVTQRPLALKFKDTEKDNCSFDAIYKLVMLNAINGYPDGTFRPNGLINRAEAAIVLVKALNLSLLEHKQVFDDVTMNNYPWAMGFINTAVENDLIKGIGNNKFGPAQNISLQDFATLLDRVIDQRKGDFQTSVKPNAKDVNEISEYAKNAVYSLIEKNILEVNADGKIRPKEAITRDKVALLLINSLEYIRGRELITPIVEAEEKIEFGEWKMDNRANPLPLFTDSLSIKRIGGFHSECLGYQPLTKEDEWSDWGIDIFITNDEYEERLRNGENVIKNEKGEVILMCERKLSDEQYISKYLYRFKEHPIYKNVNIYGYRDYKILDKPKKLVMK